METHLADFIRHTTAGREAEENTLKGSAGNIGARELQAAAQRLETACAARIQA